MRQLSSQTRFFLFSTYVVGLFLLVYHLLRLRTLEPLMLGFLCVLGSVMHILKVEGATNRSHYTISFIVYGFTLITLGLPEMILVILVSNLAEWGWNKRAWYIQVFNISCYAVAAQAAGWIYSLLNPAGGTTSPQAIIGIVLGMAGFTLLNHFLVGIIVWLARGENLKQSGIFDPITLLIDVTMLSVGASLAIVWDYNPYALLIFLIPAYPLYMTLKIPALERKTEIDSKTGLFNHPYFIEQFNNELQRANRHDRPLSIIMADLDLLRNINNTYGHLAGDEVLKGIAGILKQSVREYDIVARFGGEEFAILMPETEIEKAMERAEYIRREVEAARFIIPTSVDPIQATLSLGTSTRENFKQTSEEIIHNADTALYNSKVRGRNQVIACVQNSFNEVRRQDSRTGATEAHPSDVQSASPSDVPEYAASSRKYVSGDGEQAERVSTPEKKVFDEIQAPPPEKRHASPRGVLIYIAVLGIFAVMLSALPLLLPTGLQYSIRPEMLVGLIVITAIVMVTEWYSIDLYVKNTSLSTSAVPLVAGFMLFGPLGVLVTSLAYAATAALKFRSPANRFLFNLSNHVIAGISINLLSILTRDLSFAEAGVQHVAELGFVLLASTILFLVTTSLISIGIGIDMRRSPVDIWNEQYRWMAVYYLGIGFISYSLIFGFQHIGLPGIVVMLAPLMLLRYSQAQYIDHTREIVNELRKKNVFLEKSAFELHEAHEGLLTTLSEIIDVRDPYVLGHSKQVSRFAAEIANLLGLNEKQTDLVRKSGLLHDIGKLGISQDILTKPGRLTDSEYESIKEHASIGGELVKNNPSLRPLARIIRQHHEWYNGKGYPDKAAGTQICIEARIVAVADAMEAMTADRPYRRALKPEKVREELMKCSGTQFDPLVVEAAIKVLDKLFENETIQTPQSDAFSGSSAKLAHDSPSV